MLKKTAAGSCSVSAGKRSTAPPPRRSGRLYVRLAPAHMARLKFLLEGYGHLAVMSAVDTHAAVVRLLYAPDAEDMVMQFLREAGETLPLQPVCLSGPHGGLTNI